MEVKITRFVRALAVALCALVATALLVAAPTQRAHAENGNNYGFSDVSGDEWFAIDEVLGYATENGIISGYNDGRFGPYDNVTRGQVAVILHRLAGEPDAQADDFSDVNYGEYYGPAIRWARSAGVINGYQDADGVYRTFGPNDSVTREQLAAMLANYAREIEGIVTDTDGALLNAMPDASAVDDWARESVGWAMDSGLMSGVVEADGAYVRPLATAQRCAMAKMASVLKRDVLPPEIDPNAEQVMVYKDGVVEVDDYEVLSDGSVRVPAAKASGISAGTVVAFKPIESYPTGYTLKVSSKTTQGAYVVLSGDRADLIDVYEKLDIQGTSDAVATDIQLGDGVTMVDDATVQSLAAVGDSVNLGDVKFKISGDVLKGTSLEGADLTVKVTPVVNYKVDVSSRSLNELYASVTYDKSIEISKSGKVSVDKSFSRKVFSAPVGTPVLGCATVNLSVYLNIDIDGSVTLTVSQNCEDGFYYASGNYEIIKKRSPVDLTAELSTTLKAEADFALSINALSAEIADVSLTPGLIVAGSETVRSAGLRCCDVDITGSLEIAVGKQKNLIKDLGLSKSKKIAEGELSFHWENGQLVDGCTWSGVLYAIKSIQVGSSEWTYPQFWKNSESGLALDDLNSRIENSIRSQIANNEAAVATRTISVMYAGEDYISLIDGYSVGGGAHPYNCIEAYTFDVNTGQQVSAKSISGISDGDLTTQVTKAAVALKKKYGSSIFYSSSDLANKLIAEANDDVSHTSSLVSPIGTPSGVYFDGESLICCNMQSYATYASVLYSATIARVDGDTTKLGA